MCNTVTFHEYVCQCGWQGIDDNDIDLLVAGTWATPDYYGKWGTVEELLCSPYSAIKFCRDFEAKSGIACELDEYTVLHHLLNLRKRRFLQTFEKEYANANK